MCGVPNLLWLSSYLFSLLFPAFLRFSLCFPISFLPLYLPFLLLSTFLPLWFLILLLLLFLVLHLTSLSLICSLFVWISSALVLPLLPLLLLLLTMSLIDFGRNLMEWTEIFLFLFLVWRLDGKFRPHLQIGGYHPQNQLFTTLPRN